VCSEIAGPNPVVGNGNTVPRALLEMCPVGPNFVAKPRVEPGQLYYPAQYTHVFQKYWDYLNDPVKHPDCSESEFTKDAMSVMASALSAMDFSHFEPPVDAEASEKSYRVAFLAATSRKCPIQDATDYWSPRNAQVESDTDLPDSAPDQDSHNVDT
jgi:hypothetical protein